MLDFVSSISPALPSSSIIKSSSRSRAAFRYRTILQIRSSLSDWRARIWLPTREAMPAPTKPTRRSLAKPARSTSTPCRPCSSSVVFSHLTFSDLGHGKLLCPCALISTKRNCHFRSSKNTDSGLFRVLAKGTGRAGARHKGGNCRSYRPRCTLSRPRLSRLHNPVVADVIAIAVKALRGDQPNCLLN